MSSRGTAHNRGRDAAAPATDASGRAGSSSSSSVRACAALGLLVPALVLAPAAARAYVRTVIPGTDTCLYWSDRTLAWAPAGPLGSGLPEAELLDVVRGSFAAWTGTDCSDLAFAEQAPGPREVAFDPRGGNTNVVVFRERDCDEVVTRDDVCWQDFSCANAHDCWDLGAGLIGVTTTTYSQCTGALVDADIELNADRFDFTIVDGPTCRGTNDGACIGTDVANTMVHEIGHFVGLDHTPVDGATMRATAGFGEIEKRDLAPDDVAGLCAAYPAGAPAVRCEPAYPPEQCGEGGTTSRPREDDGCSSAGGGASLLGCTAVASLLARRRRNRAVR